MAHILVIDDDPTILKTVRAALASAGHVVTGAKDGHEALELAGRENFSLVITDANMPGGVSGFQVVANLRRLDQYLTIPVMFVSGRREKKDVIRALESGADDYLIKPIDFDLMLSKIKTLLATGRAESPISATAPINFNATCQLQFKVEGISESGLSLTSEFRLPHDFHFSIESDMFRAIGVASPELLVVSCLERPGTEKTFSVETQFLSLHETDLAKIRDWIRLAAKKQFI